MIQVILNEKVYVMKSLSAAALKTFVSWMKEKPVRELLETHKRYPMPTEVLSKMLFDAQKEVNLDKRDIDEVLKSMKDLEDIIKLASLLVKDITFDDLMDLDLKEIQNNLSQAISKAFEDFSGTEKKTDVIKE
jgi:hypothetical protein